MAELIGYVDCPHGCGNEVAVKATKKGKAYYNCASCGQFFTRTKSADESLRAKARPAVTEEPEIKEEVADDEEEGSGFSTLLG